MTFLRIDPDLSLPHIHTVPSTRQAKTYFRKAYPDSQGMISQINGLVENKGRDMDKAILMFLAVVISYTSMQLK